MAIDMDGARGVFCGEITAVSEARILAGEAKDFGFEFYWCHEKKNRIMIRSEGMIDRLAYA